jgi:hypothetical protein
LTLYEDPLRSHPPALWLALCAVVFSAPGLAQRAIEAATPGVNALFFNTTDY